MSPIRRYSVGRLINSPADVRRELEAVGTALVGAARLRGVFTTATAQQMDPLPEPGDWWFEYDPATATHTAYLQIESGGQRLRASWPVTIESA